MLHRWDISPKEAIQLQQELRERIRFDLHPRKVSHVAGVDVAYRKETGESFATIVILSFPDLEPVETVTSQTATPFPYVPGLLSFREIPPVLQAMRSTVTPIDILFVDGHGQAHPRRMGIASHLGLWLEKPTIGIGKSRLCGHYEEPGIQKGDCSPLIHREEEIGTVLRTRTGVKPIFVSVGYGLTLQDCVKWALSVTPRYRLPEPIRLADRLAGLSAHR